MKEKENEEEEMALPTTTRVAWAANLADNVEGFLDEQQADNMPGLILIQDPDTGEWYLDEGECEGPFAGDDDV